MTQLSKEEIKKTLQKWTGNNFPKSTDKTIEFYISKKIYASKKRCLHIYIKKETCDDLEFNLVIFPFKITTIGKIIEKIDGIELGKVELNSNFTVFKKMVKDEDGKTLERTGYSVQVSSQDGLVRLLKVIDEEVYSGNLKEVEQLKLTRKENLQDLYSRTIMPNN
ncbi:TPA: hypothetical protein MB324_004113 [Klebsiella pneumoniae]|nr:hypothetical protein [Klebsiella pneumoniae]